MFLYNKVHFFPFICNCPRIFYGEVLESFVIFSAILSAIKLAVSSTDF